MFSYSKLCILATTQKRIHTTYLFNETFVRVMQHSREECVAEKSPFIDGEKRRGYIVVFYQLPFFRDFLVPSPFYRFLKIKGQLVLYLQLQA